MSVHRWAFFVWQPPISRGTKTTRWPSEPVEENMTSDLTAFSLMAHGNGLKFMTRAKIQVSKLRYLLRLFYSVLIHEFIQNLNISYFLEELSQLILGKPNTGPLQGFGYWSWPWRSLKCTRFTWQTLETSTHEHSQIHQKPLQVKLYR